MTTFALVHGGGHGAWCWARVVPVLGAMGHRGVAMDLPIEDDSKGASVWADVVVDALDDFPEPLVIVGHSLGGLVVPLVAGRRPTRRMIFLAATLPVPGKSLDEQKLEEPDMLRPYVGEHGGLNKERFYNTCSAEDAEWAFRQMRYQSRRVFEEVTPLEAWPAIPSSYIVCTEDQAVNPAWGRRVARDRLGVAAVEIVGSDHSPMLHHPAEFARLLVELSEQSARRGMQDQDPMRPGS